MTQPTTYRERAALVIVAHPDDEVIWCGGLILQNPRWDWTILSLSRADDPDRRPRFDRACERLGARGLISDLDDSALLAPISPPEDIGRRILRHLGGRAWDLCVTHGAGGEYGHIRHRQIHHEVLRLWAEALLWCRELWTFAYDLDVGTGLCSVRGDADIQIALTEEQLAEKKRLVTEVYGFARGSFEVSACLTPETFHRQRLQGAGAKE